MNYYTWLKKRVRVPFRREVEAFESPHDQRYSRSASDLKEMKDDNSGGRIERKIELELKV